MDTPLLEVRDLVQECGETAIFVRLIARVPVCVQPFSRPAPKAPLSPPPEAAR